MRRFLIVDDHHIVRRGVGAFLESRHDWTVVAEAADAESAIALAQQTQPDIAIIDYGLPKMNGVELTRILKEAMPRLEVIVFTGRETGDLISEALTAGARAFVLKAAPGKHLLEAIDAVSRGKVFISGEVARTHRDAKPMFEDRRPSVLTPREREVVRYIAEGKTNKETASILNISARTVEAHRRTTMEKLELNTAAELIRYAIRNKLIAA